ncbi:MAG: TPM domain-containing protein [Polyangiaceae bacterium]
MSIAALHRSSLAARMRALLASFVLTLTLLLGTFSYAPSIAWAFDPPAIQGFVTDTSGKLTDNDRKVINARLSAYKKVSGNRIAVFMVGSLEGEPIADVAYRTFNTWKIGTAGEDNGVLLVIAPNESKGWIETGKGVGGAITDIQADEILRNVVAPHVQAGRWRDAAIDGSDAIAHLLDKDRPPSSTTPGATPSTRPSRHHRPSILGTILKAGLVGIIILGVVGLLFIYVLYRIVRRVLRGAVGGEPPRGSVGNYPGSYGGYSGYGSSYEPPRPGGFIIMGGGHSHRRDDDDDDNGSGGYDPDDTPAGGGESGGGGAGEDF